jgi:hypothetical protein
MLTPTDVEDHFTDLCGLPGDPFVGTAIFIQTFAAPAAVAPCLIHLKQIRLRLEKGVSDAD